MHIKNNDYTPHWKLRRLAPRALRALEAHGKTAPFLGAFEMTLRPAAQKFMDAFDASRTAEAASNQVKAGRDSLERLRASVRGWLGHFGRDVPDFDAAGLGTADVPDDLIAGATRMLHVVTSPRAVHLSYAAAAEADLRAAIENAAKGWGDAHARLTGQQDLLKQTREAATAFQAELVAFRRALRVTLGTSHRDFQALRVREITGLESQSEGTGAADASASTAPAVDPSAPTVPMAVVTSLNAPTPATEAA